MFCTCQANSLGSKLDGLFHLFRRVGVGADSKFTKLVCPAHELHELFVSIGAFASGFVLDQTLNDLGRRRLDGTLVDVSNESVQRKVITFFESLSISRECLLAIIDGHAVGTADANLTHLAGNESGV